VQWPDARSFLGEHWELKNLGVVDCIADFVWLAIPQALSFKSFSPLSQNEKGRKKQNPPLKSPPLQRRKERNEG
jgi:hypothetical protein